MVQVGDVIVSPDVFTQCFCCDLDACGGACCVEGESGAPLKQEEVLDVEEALDDVWSELSPKAQAVINEQGVATIDRDGELVTTIVDGMDCVFTCYETSQKSFLKEAVAVPTATATSQSPLVKEGAICFCALEKVCRFKPISCALYPIREKQLSGGMVGINVHRWNVCEPARKKGGELGLRVYEFLRAPLVRRFGQEWYDELCNVAEELRKQELIQ